MADLKCNLRSFDQWWCLKHSSLHHDHAYHPHPHQQFRLRHLFVFDKGTFYFIFSPIFTKLQ